MRSRLIACVILIASGVTLRTHTDGQPDRWVSGFYVGYMSSQYPPAAIDFSSLTHVMVFSVLPRADGTLDTNLFIDSSNGPAVAQEVARRAHAAGRKAILTIGGSDTAGRFRLATSPARVATFKANLLAVVEKWGFDGIDIDWEPIERIDYVSLIALVEALKVAKPSLIVTTDVGWKNANWELTAEETSFYRQLSGVVDQMNMMTYGMADNWGDWAVWHSSAVFGAGADHPSSVRSSTEKYLAAGVAPRKLGIGIGFYGSCWSKPASAPLQRAGGAAVVASDNDMGYAVIKNDYYRARNYRYDSQAHAPYLTFLVPTGPRGCTLISYEDETSVAAKGRYVAETGLGGTIIWQLNEGYNPKEPNPNSLLQAVARAFLRTQ